MSQVRAEAQSKLHDALKGGTFLTEEEKTILRWGRNATGTLPKRHKQSELTKEVYRNATAIECLVRILHYIYVCTIIVYLLYYSSTCYAQNLQVHICIGRVFIFN